MLQNSFERTGICPFKPEIAIFNKRTNPNYHQVNPKRLSYFNTFSENLTTDQNILSMYNLEYNKTLQSINEIPKPYYNFLPTYFSLKQLSQGVGKNHIY